MTSPEISQGGEEVKLATYFDTDTYPNDGDRVSVVRLENTAGMLIHPRHLIIRAAGMTGTVINYVPGHGGDVWFVLHDKQLPDDPNAIAAYSVGEIAIWFIAVIGAHRLKLYATSIKKSSDGAALNLLANALLLMALYIVLLTMYSTVIGLFKDTSYLKTAVALGNHIPLIVAIGASYLFLRGSQKLGTLAAFKTSRSAFLSIVLIYVVLSGLFAWNFYYSFPNLQPHEGIPRFAFSRAALLLTYVLPHLIMWLMGLMACINIGAYSIKVKGALYRELFSHLYRGVLLVFLCTFIAQLIVMTNVTLDKFSWMLLFIYALLLLGTCGFMLIYRGSKKLSLIEK